MAMRAAASAFVWRQRRSPSNLSVISSHLNLKRILFSASRPHLHLEASTSTSPRNRKIGLKIPTRAVQGTTIDPTRPKEKDDELLSPKEWKIKMLYDGDCPLCMREVNMLMERNKRFGTIKFVDISSDDYSPKENEGLDYKTVMGRIHAILSDGTVVTDVEAFRRLYEQVGLGWVYAITKYEPISSIAHAIYSVWAKYRLPITGRPPLEKILEARKKKVETCGDSSSCEM